MTVVQMAAALPAASPVAAARRSDGGEFARHLETAASPAGGADGGKGSSASATDGVARNSSGSAQEQEPADAPATLPGAAPLAGHSDGEGEASSVEPAPGIVGADGDPVANVGAGSDLGDIVVEAGDPSEAVAEDATPGVAAIATTQATGGGEEARLTAAASAPSTGSRTPAGPGAPAAPSTPVGADTSAVPSAGAAAPAQSVPTASAGLAGVQPAVPGPTTAAPGVTDAVAATPASGQETQARTDGMAMSNQAPVATTSASPAAPAAPPPAPSPPLAPQLAPQLSHLRQLPQGEHVMTLSVTPDTFGPIKVVAHITAEGTTVQLLGSTEAGREALRAALADLRRDLAATGLDARLDLGSGRGEAGSPDGRGPRAGARDTAGTLHGDQGQPGALTPTPTPVTGQSRGVDLYL